MRVVVWCDVVSDYLQPSLSTLIILMIVPLETWKARQLNLNGALSQS